MCPIRCSPSFGKGYLHNWCFPIRKGTPTVKMYVSEESHGEIVPRSNIGNPQVSVPKILTPFIPEILARGAMAGRTRNLSVLRLARRAGRREEDVGNAKTTRSRNLVEGRSPEDGGSGQEEFPETSNGDSGRKTRTSFAGNPAAGAAGWLSRRQNRLLCPGGL